MARSPKLRDDVDLKLENAAEIERSASDALHAADAQLKALQSAMAAGDIEGAAKLDKQVRDQVKEA